MVVGDDRQLDHRVVVSGCFGIPVSDDGNGGRPDALVLPRLAPRPRRHLQVDLGVGQKLNRLARWSRLGALARRDDGNRAGLA